MPDFEVLDRLAREVLSVYENMGALSVTPRLDEATLAAEVARAFDFESPTPLDRLIGDSSGLLRDGSTHVAHPRYYGFFNPSVSMASVCADALVSVYNPQLAVWAHAPAAVEIESRLLEYLAGRLGFDPGTTAGSHFTTGGTEANNTALLAALSHRFPSYAEDGLVGLGVRPRVYLSEQGHESFEKVTQMAGLSRRAVCRIPTDSVFAIDLAALERAVESDRREGFTPLMLVATAGTTTLGAIDPMGGAARLAREQGLWLHVDAAWGGAAVMSPQLAPHLQGIELSDSVTIDAHKWFSVSMGAGMFFCRHPEALARVFGISTAYMPDSDGARREPYATTMQWSRRFIGLKLAMSLAEIGASAMAARIEHQAAMGERLRRLLVERGFELVHRSPLPLVCFTHPALSGSSEPASTYSGVAERVQRSGHWIASVRVRGQPVLRACVTSFRTQAEDIDALADALVRALQHPEGDSSISGT